MNFLKIHHFPKHQHKKFKYFYFSDTIVPPPPPPPLHLHHHQQLAISHTPSETNLCLIVYI